jgi:hypothetical protein
MIFAINPLFVPTLEWGFQWKIEEIVIWPSLDPNTANHLPFGSTGLIFLEEIVFKEREIWENGKISLTQVDKDDDLKDRVWIQMNQFDFVVMKKVTRNSQVGRPNPRWKKEVNTKISLVLGVGIYLSFAGRHWRTAWEGRRWLSMSLWSSLSSTVEGRNITRWEEAMTRMRGFGLRANHKSGGKQGEEEGSGGGVC